LLSFAVRGSKNVCAHISNFIFLVNWICVIIIFLYLKHIITIRETMSCRYNYNENYMWPLWSMRRCMDNFVFLYGLKYLSSLHSVSLTVGSMSHPPSLLPSPLWMATDTNYPRARGQKSARARIRAWICTHRYGCGFLVEPDR